MTIKPNERVAVGDRVSLVPRGAKRIWTAEYHQDGKHHRKSMRTANFKVAHAMALKLAVSLQEGTLRPTLPAITIEAAVKDFLDYLKMEGRADSTRESYDYALERWKTYLARYGVRRLNQITASHFDRYRTERSGNRKSTTVYLDGILIKAFQRWAKSRKLLTEDPLAEVRVKRPPLHVKFCPTLKQVNAVLDAAAEPLRSQLATLTFTGMRVGDLQRLRLQDVDLKKHWIDVVSRPGAETKSRQSRRVPIHPRLRPILAALPKTPRDLLFAAKDDAGKPIRPRNLNDKLRTLLKKLKFPTGRENGFVLHSLRHFFETQAVNSGVPQPVIDRWLGHKPDPTVMINVYYNLEDDVSQEKMLLVDFGGTSVVSPEAAPTAFEDV